MSADPHAPVIRRVLLAFDGSPSAAAALDVAIDEALARDVDLQVVTVVASTGFAVDLTVYGIASDEAAVRAEVAAVRRMSPDRVHTRILSGEPSALLLGAVRTGDLLVVGTHGHRPLARVLLGSTSTALVTHAPCPVLVVRAGSSHQAPVVRVGVDGSASSVAAVLLAADEADRRGWALEAVMAVSPFVDAAGFVSGPDRATLEEAEALLGEALGGVLEEHPGLVVRRTVVQSHPVEALLRRNQDVGLVVVGSRGLGGLKRMLLGSVSRECAHRATCPVLVVRPSVVVEPDEAEGGRRLVDA